MDKESKKTAKKPDEPKKRPGEIAVRMKIDEKREWNFVARNAYDAVIEGKRICKDNEIRFPQDVVVWDFS